VQPTTTGGRDAGEIELLVTAGLPVADPAAMALGAGAAERSADAAAARRGDRQHAGPMPCVGMSVAK
jgi:hypothetical protein